MIGETILHYKIIEKLGEGGMGIVYKAHDTKLDRTVALKFLPNYLTGDSNEKERFYHESRAAASLTHQNIAVIYEINEHDEKIFLAMEYVEGKTLKKIIEHESETLTIKKVLEIAIQACEGLATAHEKGIVHRDIKSDNIMLTPKGQVKIMDFGLAKVKGASKLTKAGSTVGTTAYMSPEQAQGEEVDARSDIFSFGIVLYELLTAHLPFRGEHQAALLYSLVNEDPQPIARFNDKVTQDLERIVFKAMAKDKDERYQHVDDMMADLRHERKNLEYAKTEYVKRPEQQHQLTNNKSKSKKKFLGILIPIAAIILIAILYFTLNPFVSAPNSEKGMQRKTLAVMYFENIPDPSDSDHTGEMLTNLLITSLSQIKGLEVISRERLLDIQKDIGQNTAKDLTPSYADQVATRAGVSTMLIGSILQTNPTLAITTRLIDVKSGNILSSQQVKNFSSNHIFKLVDSLSYLLRDKLGVNPSSSVEKKSIAEVTTKSTEAYRAYVEGLDFLNNAYIKQAYAAFTRAVELDSSFAIAYLYLSKLQYYNGKFAASMKSIQKAVSLSSKTTERERLQILAQNFTYNNNSRKAAEISLQLINKYPHEIQTYSTLGSLYGFSLLEPSKAVEIIQRGLKIEPSEKELWNSLGYFLAVLNKKQEALNAVKKYIVLSPAEPNPYDTQGDIYALYMDYDSSRASFQKAIDLRSDFISAEKLGFYALINEHYKEAEKYFEMISYPLPEIEIYHGQFQIAQKKLIKYITSELSMGKLVSSSAMVLNIYYETGQYQEMLRFLKELTTSSMSEATNKYLRVDAVCYLAWSFVMNGRNNEADSLLNSIPQNELIDNPRDQAKIEYTFGLILFEEGKYVKALEKFKKAFGMLPPIHEPNIFYAICMLKNGEISSAVKEFKRLEYWPPIQENFIIWEVPGGFEYWPISAVKAHYWLGVAYEKQNKKKEALTEYNKFLEIWKDPDFNSSEIKDAKIRLAKLK